MTISVTLPQGAVCAHVYMECNDGRLYPAGIYYPVADTHPPVEAKKGKDIFAACKFQNL